MSEDRISDAITSIKEKARAADTRQPDRLEKLGHAPARQPHARKQLVKLNWRSQMMLRYMVDGIPEKEAELALRMGVGINQPLNAQQAGDAAGFKRANARFVFNQRIFRQEFNREIAALIDGGKAKAVHALLEIVEEKGENTAADRTVRLKAATAILGDQVGPSKPAVNLTVNNGVQLTAGIVVRLGPHTPQTPLEQAQTIDAKPIALALDETTSQLRATRNDEDD